MILLKVLNERECGRGFSDFRLDGRKDNFPYAMTMAYIVMFAFLGLMSDTAVSHMDDTIIIDMNGCSHIKCTGSRTA